MSKDFCGALRNGKEKEDELGEEKGEGKTPPNKFLETALATQIT